nr:hypothetical protein [Verrucomicrobium sp. BvORR034]
MKTLVQSLHDLPGCEHAKAGGGQFNGQRDAVQSTADLRDEVEVVRAQQEAGTDGSGPVEEKPDRFELCQLLDDRRFARDLVSMIWQRKRWERPCPFARDAQGLATGGQNVELRTGAQKGLSQICAGGDDVFAVIEDQQEALFADEPGKCCNKCLLRLPTQIECSGDAIHDNARISDGGEFRKSYAIWKLIVKFGRRLQGESRLADTSRAREGEQACAPKEAFDFSKLVLTPNKARELQRQIVWRAFQRPQGWEIRWEIDGGELKEMLGTSKIAESMLAERPQMQSF